MCLLAVCLALVNLRLCEMIFAWKTMFCLKGEDALKAWATSIKNDEAVEPSKRKILFIDEANLSHKQWSVFEGLFHQPQNTFN